MTRSLAIILAMMSHAFVAANSFGAMPVALKEGLRFVMQMAPPTFILLFGAMLEVVYRNRVEKGQLDSVTKRLLSRSLQCAILYIVTFVPMILTGNMSPGYALRSALFMSVTPFADILKFYAIVLIFAPAILLFRIRFGLIPLVLTTALIHLVHPLIGLVPEPPLFNEKDYFGQPLKFLFNVGDSDVGGPSVLHGLTLVFWGMTLGDFIRRFTDKSFGSARLAFFHPHVWCCFIGLLYSVYFVSSFGLADTVSGVSSMSLRNDNHPSYFALGLICSTFFVLVFTCIFDESGAKAPPLLIFIGSVSLFTFSFGNILLYIAFYSPKLLDPIVYGLLLTFAVILQSYLFWFFQQKTEHDSELRQRIRYLIQRPGKFVDNAMKVPSQVYTRLLLG